MAEPTYVTAGAWGSGTGSRLSAATVDANFWAVVQRLVALETGDVDPVGIANITVVGSQMTIILTDATELGPFTLPYAAFLWVDEWEPSTNYIRLSVFKVQGDGVYLVLKGHTSDTEFDPEATDASSNQLYQKMLDESDGALRGAEEVTASAYAPTLNDNGKLKFCTNAAGCAIEIPTDDVVNFPVGAVLSFEADTDGAVYVEGVVGTGGTDDTSVVDCPSSLIPQAAEKHAVISVIKKAANHWVVTGFLATA